MRGKGLWGLIVAALMSLPLRMASAQVTADRSASLLVFPRVIADDTADTVIHITNMSSVDVLAHCWYVSGAAIPPVLSQWQTIDFAISLTPQQPTHWVASRGRHVDPTDGTCTPADHGDCDGAGFDPGNVPALPPGFRGELTCIEVDAAGAPVNGNHLIGVATVQQLNGGPVTKYNAIGARSRDTNNNDGVLCLGGQVTSECPTGAEYDACPQTWILNHLADGTEDPLSGPGATVTTSITVMPCSQDFERQVPSPVTLQFVVTNDFEQSFSAATTVTCWGDFPLSTINAVFARETVGTDFLQTRIRTAPGATGGVMLAAQATRTSGGPGSPTASTAISLYVEGTQLGPDVIKVPVSQGQ